MISREAWVLSGQRGKYLLDAQPVGTGGFSEVYRAVPAEGEAAGGYDELAVKIARRFAPGTQGEALASEGIKTETAVLTRMGRRPHVVPLVDVGQATDGRPFLVLPLCRSSLRGCVPANGRVRISQLGVAALLVQAAAGVDTLGYLYQGAHGDIKPDNFLLPRVLDFGVRADFTTEPEDMCWLADFGTATRLGRSAHPAYTADYVTPERHRAIHAGHQAAYAVTPRDDVYALGVTLGELLFGTRNPATWPLRGFGPDGSVTDEQFMRIRSVLEAAVAVDPAERLQTVAAFRYGLMGLGEAPKPPLGRRAWMIALTADKLPALRWPETWKGHREMRAGDLVLAYCSDSKDPEVRAFNPFQPLAGCVCWVGLAAGDALRDRSEDTGREGWYFPIGTGAELPRPVRLTGQPGRRASANAYTPVTPDVPDGIASLWGTFRGGLAGGVMQFSEKWSPLLAWILSVAARANPGHPVLEGALSHGFGSAGSPAGPGACR